jgi:hypothetical protein
MADMADMADAAQPLSELEREAADPDTPPERLELLARDVRLLVLVAANPSTPAPTLDRLKASLDEATRAAVAANPNAALETLLDLASEFPAEFMRNPVLPLLLLERPDLPAQMAAEMTPHAAAGVLRCERVHQVFLKPLTASRHESVRDLVRIHVRIAGELGTDGPMTALTAFRQALEEPAFWDPAAPFELPSLIPVWFLDLLVGAASHGVARCPDTPPELLDRVARECRAPDTLLAVARHPHTGPETLTRLARAEFAAVRAAVAAHPSTPTLVLNALAVDRDLTVLCAVAVHPRTSPLALQMLSLEFDAEVRAAVARNPHAPPDVRQRLIRGGEPRPSVSPIPQFSPELLARWARDRNPVVRRAVARHPDTPPHTLARLAEDADRDVRAGVAGRAGVPQLMLRSLAADVESAVRRSAATHPQLPHALLERLAQDDDVLVRQAVARRVDLSPAVLRCLAGDADAGVRETLARNPHTPYTTVRRLWDKADVEQLPAIARHPSVTPARRTQLYTRLLLSFLRDTGRSSSLRRLAALASDLLDAQMYEWGAASPHWTERYVVACNPTTPLATVRALTHDGIIYVRAAARAQLSSRDPSQPSQPSSQPSKESA